MIRKIALCFLFFLLVPFLCAAEAQNEYSLFPVDLVLAPCDTGGIVVIDIMVQTAVVNALAFLVPLRVTGTANPVLDTALTGSSTNPNPPGFAPPSLAAYFTIRKVDETGPPDLPLAFFAWDGAGIHTPAYGLFCRMFYRVSGPGTIVIDSSFHPSYGEMGMNDPNGSLSIYWDGPYTFEVIQPPLGDVYRDGKLSVLDVIKLIQYLFKGGPSPDPIEVADVNLDGRVNVTDVLILVNYLFKGGPKPSC